MVKLSLFNFILLIMVGCSSAPTIIEREIEVPIYIPAVADTVVLKDTIDAVGDSVWFSDIKDSLENVIGDLTIWWQKKLASVNIKAKTDTIIHTFTDTVFVKQDPNILGAVASTLNWYEKLILYGGIGIILALLVWIKTKGIKLGAL